MTMGTKRARRLDCPGAGACVVWCLSDGCGDVQGSSDRRCVPGIFVCLQISKTKTMGNGVFRLIGHLQQSISTATCGAGESPPKKAAS